mgnify:CR=1
MSGYTTGFQNLSTILKNRECSLRFCFVYPICVPQYINSGEVIKVIQWLNAVFHLSLTGIPLCLSIDLHGSKYIGSLIRILLCTEHILFSQV